MQGGDRQQSPAHAGDRSDHVARSLTDHEPRQQCSSYEAEKIGRELDRLGRFHSLSVESWTHTGASLPRTKFNLTDENSAFAIRSPSFNQLRARWLDGHNRGFSFWLGHQSPTPGSFDDCE